MEPLRSCPICPKCGKKKFQRIKGTQVRVKCLSCSKIITI